MTKSPNLRAIRARLPHGSIGEIAERTGLTLKTVSLFFNRGWYKEHTDAILTEAVGILRGSTPDGDLLLEIEDLGLTGGGTFIRKKKKSNPGNPGGGGNIILTIGIVVLFLFFLVPQFKAFVLGIWSKVAGGMGGRLTSAQMDDIISKGGAHKYV